MENYKLEKVLNDDVLASFADYDELYVISQIWFPFTLSLGMIPAVISFLNNF